MKTRAFVIVTAAIMAGSVRAEANDWPPIDPGNDQAAVALTAEWATSVRGIRSFRQLQNAAGTPGRITSFETHDETPRVVYDWVGGANSGRMRAFVYKDGGFAAIITPAANGGEIVLNSFGAFVCPTCSPPVNACGLRPSWVPHDLHWDNFDCLHTLTGPQSLQSPEP